MMANVEKRIETAKTIQVNRRNYRRARDRALARLAGIYKEDYLSLLEEERIRDAAEGKSWLDIDGRTRSSLGGTGASNRNAALSIRDTDSNESQARHLAGEK